MKTLLFMLLFPIAAMCQSHCDKNTGTMIDFNVQMGGSRFSAQANAGITTKGETHAFAVSTGVKMFDLVTDEKKQTVDTRIIPVITFLVKQRIGDVVQGIAVTTGPKYIEVNYRAYIANVAPGIIVSYNKYQGLMGGVIITGIF